MADDPVAKKAFFGKDNISFTLKSSSLTEGDNVYSVTGPVRVNVYADEGEKEIRFGDEIAALGSRIAQREPRHGERIGAGRQRALELHGHQHPASATGAYPGD